MTTSLRRGVLPGVLLGVLLSRFGTLDKLGSRVITACIKLIVFRLDDSRQFFGSAVLHPASHLGCRGSSPAGTRHLPPVVDTAPPAIAGLLILTIAPVTLYQVIAYPQALNKWYLPTSQSGQGELSGFPGTTLQLGNRALIRIDAETTELPWTSQVTETTPRPDEYTGRTSADLMLLDRVVLQRKQYPGADNEPAPLRVALGEVPEVAQDQIYVL
ncbi:unnamed protein product, partial [Mesorhabditis spiculigera]